MKYVSGLAEAEAAALECAHKNHPSAGVRNRAYMIILSNKGRTYALGFIFLII
jgi:hypothetical protein